LRVVAGADPDPDDDPYRLALEELRGVVLGMGRREENEPEKRRKPGFFHLWSLTLRPPWPSQRRPFCQFCLHGKAAIALRHAGGQSAARGRDRRSAGRLSV